MAEWTEISLERKKKQIQLLTNAYNLLNFDTRGVDLFGKLTDGLVWILIGKGVNVYPYSWGKKFAKKKGRKQKIKKAVYNKG